MKDLYKICLNMRSQKMVIFLVLIPEENLQLPNFNGQACASMGKSSSCMGHSAEMVNLWKSKKKTHHFFFPALSL